MSGFLKKPIGGKKSGKKKKKKEDGEEGKGMGSDGEERRSETPTPEQGEEEGAGEPQTYYLNGNLYNSDKGHLASL